VRGGVRACEEEGGVFVGGSKRSLVGRIRSRVSDADETSLSRRKNGVGRVGCCVNARPEVMRYENITPHPRSALLALCVIRAMRIITNNVNDTCCATVGV